MAAMLEGKRIAFVLPCLPGGSGGIQTVCRHIGCLRRRGAICEIHLIDGGDGRGEAELVRTLGESYQLEGVPVRPIPRYGEPFDVVVATMYSTVAHARRFGCPVTLYFVQDFEPWFFPMGDERLRALSTYHGGLRPVTIGRWLARKLRSDFGAACDVTDFCADQGTYHPVRGVARELAVCAIDQPAKPHRCAGLLHEALSIVHELRPEVRILLFGGDVPEDAVSVSERLGLLSKEECNGLYNHCALGVCMSSSNPSRIPFEMMAAGLPVVDLDLPNNRDDLCGGGVLLAQPEPAAVASAIVELLDDEPRRMAMSDEGVRFMSARPIDLEGRQFCDAVERALDGGEPLPVPNAGEGLPSRPSLACSPSADALKVAGRRDLERMDAHNAALLPLVARWVDIRVGGVPRELPFDEARAYVWPQDHQELMQCVLLARGADGTLEGGFDVSALQCATNRINVHLYLKDGGRDRLVAATQRRIALPGGEGGIEVAGAAAAAADRTEAERDQIDELRIGIELLPSAEVAEEEKVAAAEGAEPAPSDRPSLRGLLSLIRRG